MSVYSGLATITEGNSGVYVTLPEPGFPNTKYSVSVNALNYEGSGCWVRISSSTKFFIGSYSSGQYQWIATNQNGAGGSDFSGPAGAVLWYDGTAITGTSEFTWTQTGGMGAYRLFGGPNGNYLELDSGGSMSVTIDQIDDGHNILLSAGATRITLTDDVKGESGLTGTLQLQISGNNGASGNVLTSDGTYATWQAPERGPTGADGPTGTILNFRGSWNYSTSSPPFYSVNDVVVNNLVSGPDGGLNLVDNNTYVCVGTTGLSPYGNPPPISSDGTPNSSIWTLFAHSGISGPTGADGQSSSYFDYRADSTTAPPIGHIAWSNFATQINSTYIRVNHISQDGVDVDIFLNLVQQGNTLIIQDKNVSANFQKWLVSGAPIPNTGSGYVQYPVTLTSSGGSPQFANNHQLILATIVPGPQGPPGPTGATGTMDASMSWAFDGAGLSGSTVCNLAPPYTWTAGGGIGLTGGTYQLIRTMTTIIPEGWVPKTNTLINLFLWNTFAGAINVNPTTQQYFTYSLNGGAEQPLSKTSGTRPYGNQGKNQFFPITGNLLGVPLASGDSLVIRFYGRLFPGSLTHNMDNPTEQAYGAFTTGY